MVTLEIDSGTLLADDARALGLALIAEAGEADRRNVRHRAAGSPCTCGGSQA